MKKIQVFRDFIYMVNAMPDNVYYRGKYITYTGEFLDILTEEEFNALEMMFLLSTIGDLSLIRTLIQTKEEVKNAVELFSSEGIDVSLALGMYHNLVLALLSLEMDHEILEENKITNRIIEKQNRLGVLLSLCKLHIKGLAKIKGSINLVENKLPIRFFIGKLRKATGLEPRLKIFKKLAMQKKLPKNTEI